MIISASAEEYIDTNIDRLQSFILWRSSERRRAALGSPSQIDLDQLLEALRIGRVGLSKSSERADGRKILNNVVYYMLEALKVAADTNLVAENLPTLAELSAVTAELALFVERTGSDNVMSLHTLLESYSFLGEQKQGREIATRILDLNASGKVADNSATNDVIVRRAWEVVRAAVQ
jgi:hypothetical protein